MKIVSSERNQSIKKYLKLLKGNLEDDRLLPLEGARLGEEALNSGSQSEDFFYVPELIDDDKLMKLMDLLPSGAKKIAITEGLLKKMAETKTPQGIMAIASYPYYDYKEVLESPGLLAVLVDQIQDPGNMGTIIRSAAGAGCDAVFYTPGTVRYSNPKVLRSTAGILFNIKVIPIDDLKEFSHGVKANNISLFAADADAPQYYFEADFRKPAVILIVNENKGISKELQEMNYNWIRIPLMKGVESLNAGVAAGIIVFEAAKQREYYTK